MRLNRLNAVVGACLALSFVPVFAEDPLPAPKHRVMLLGTFHFEDAGLDDFKPEFNIDVMAEQRQQEIAQVLSILETYRPTKIAVEQTPDRQGWLDGRYNEYIGGKFELPANEIFQLGFRLARTLGHSRVHAIDAERRWYEPYVNPEEYAIEHGQRELVESPWYGWYQEMAQAEDKLKTQTTIGEYLLHLNRPERIRKGHGIYLVGTFKAGIGDEYPGADGKTAWYNRNLRIFNNIQRITEDSEERILVIIGAGHLPILRHCVDASPEYELVEPASLVEGLTKNSVPAIDGAALLRAHTYELEHHGGLAGPGLDFLVSETENAQFVLLGEPHNTNQVNEFAGKLFEALSTAHGFNHLVTEQDALIMDRFTSPETRGSLDRIRSEAKNYPDALHFFTDEEFALHAKIGRLSQAEHPLWGVDRIHDAALAFEALLGTDVSAEDRRRIRAVLDEIRRNGNGRSVSAESTLFDDLLLSDYEAGSRAAQILHALRTSREDFQAYQTEHEPGDPWGFIANERREELMKTRFMQHYRRALAAGGGTLPRAIAKLGHWHLMRGHGPGSVPTLGSFMVDAARFNGMSTISISIQPVNEPGRHWSITDHEFAPLTVDADPTKWKLIDLRPLRGHIHSGALRVSKDVEETVFGFDLLLLMGGTDKGEATWAE